MVVEFVVFLNFSCVQSKNENYPIHNNNVVDININPNEKLRNFGDFIKNVDYVRLETNDSCLIGEISKTIITDSTIIICDMKYSLAIYIFDLNGNFKCKIEKKGKGPEEYSSIYDVSISFDGSIWIFDMDGRKILEYAQTGEYISKTGLPFFFRKFEFISDREIAFFISSSFNINIDKEDHKYSLIRSDLSGKSIRASFIRKYDDTKFDAVTDNPLRVFDNCVYFNPCFSDTIYSVKEDSLIAKYKIKISSTKHIPPITKETNNSDFQNWINNHYLFLGDYIVLEDYVIVFIAVKEGYPYVIYSDSDNKTFPISGTHKSIIEFLFREPVSRFRENTAVVAIHPMEIKSLEEQILNSKSDMLLQNLIKEIDVNDNPILFFYEFKDTDGYSELVS
jgi:hypothetical protein